MRLTKLLLGVPVLVILAGLRPTYAQSIWHNAAGGTWMDTVNWSSGVPHGIGHQAVFEPSWPSSRATITLPSPITLSDLIVENPQRLTFAGAGPLSLIGHGAVDPGIRIPAINANTTISTPLAWSERAVVDVGSNSILTIDQSLSRPSGSLIVQGAGSLYLDGGNPEWRGALEINSGLVRVRSAQALGAGPAQTSSSTLIGSQGTLLLDGSFDVPTELFRLDGGTLKARASAGNGVRILSEVELLSASKLEGPATARIMTFAGSISGPGGLETSGLVEFEGDNRYQGPTNVNSGMLTAVGSQALGLSGQIDVQSAGTLRLFGDYSAHQVRLHGGRLEGNLSSGPGGPGAIGNIELSADSVLGGNLDVLGQITGVGELRLAGNAITLHQDNSYTGLTRVTGTAVATSRLALGDPSVPTRVETRGILTLQSDVAERIELHGGTLDLGRGSQSYSFPVVAWGGTITSREEAVNVPLVLQAGQITVQLPQGEFRGGVTGQGNLVVQGAIITTAPLAHEGNIEFENGVIIETANTYTGETRIIGSSSNGAPVVARNPEAFGASRAPIQMQDSHLVLEAAVDRDITMDASALGITATAAGYDGLITVLDNPQGQHSYLSVDGLVGSNLQLDGSKMVIRRGQLNGDISGDGGLIIHSESADDTVGLNGQNSYRGPTSIYYGITSVNSPTALGAADTGTFVRGGVLEINAPSHEPLTVVDHGEIVLNHPVQRLPVFGTVRGQPGASSRVRLNVPGSFGDVIVTGGTLETNADVSVKGLLFRDTGNLQINPGHTLTVLDDFRVHSGQVDVEGHISATQPLVKATGGRADFYTLKEFAGDIHVESGTVTVRTSDALGTMAGRTRVSSNGASLIIPNGVELNENIDLIDAQGTRFYGGLGFDQIGLNGVPSILRGELFLGDSGSKVSGAPGGQLEIRGPISGSSLLRTSRDDNHGDNLFLTNPDNRFTGLANLQGGITTLRGSGRLSTPSSIIVGLHGHLFVHNTPAESENDRLGDGVPIEMDGGLFTYFSSPTVNAVETAGPLTLRRSASSVRANGDDGVVNQLTFASLNREPGATGHFDVGPDQQIHFSSPPSLTNDMVGAWATAARWANGRHTTAFATYGPDGLVPITKFVTDINLAGPQDNVDWTDGILLADRSVNSLLIGEGQNELGGHRLTIESGGIMGRGSLVDGEITSGSSQELIIYEGTQVHSTIVDNERGPVDVTVVSGGWLMSPNQHTGVTRLIGRSYAADTYLVDGAIFPGAELVLDRVNLRIIDSGNQSVWHLGDLTITGDSKASFNRLDAQQIDFQSGELYGQLYGAGSIRKTEDGTAHLWTDFSNFTGRIDVEQGMLWVNTSAGLPPTSIHSGGTLSLGDNSSHSLRTPIELAGGVLELGQITVDSPVSITKASTIRTLTPVTSSHSFRGELLGDAPLSIVGDGTSLTVYGTNPDFSGPVTIESATVSVQNEGLGIGGITLLPEGRLLAVSTDNATGQTVPWTTPLVLDGGELLNLSVNGQPVSIAGPVVVKSRSLVGNRNYEDVLVFDGSVHLDDHAELMLNGLGTVHFAGPIFVEGSAAIDAQVRQVDEHASGIVRITGPITADSPEARLDLVAVGVDIEASLHIPMGQSLQILVNGQPAPVELSAPGQVLAGNGVLENDTLISGGAAVQPGASVGRLMVDGHVRLGQGGVLEWELSDAAPGDVNTRGWDQLQTDSLQITSSVDSPFVIRVIGLDQDGQRGQPANFDVNRSGRWNIVVADETAPFDRDQISIDHSQLATPSPPPADARWYASRRDAGLSLTYLVPSEVDRIHDMAQRFAFVHDLAGTWFGDTNWDGKFDSADLVAVFRAGHYEDGVASNSTWSTGDWNGDGDFSSGDLVLAFKDGGFSRAADAAFARAVPEPTSLILTVTLPLIVAWHHVIGRRRPLNSVGLGRHVGAKSG